jgi:hypothetical protein
MTAAYLVLVMSLQYKYTVTDATSLHRSLRHH